MFAFVGFIAGENNVHFPWSSTLSGVTYDSIAAAGGAPAQWDAVPTAAKWQIFLLIGLLEFWGEGGGRGEMTHYMKGGKRVQQHTNPSSRAQQSRHTHQSRVPRAGNAAQAWPVPVVCADP